MEPNIERLEACYQANVEREHLCMQSWDRCLIGGYCKGLAREIESLTITFLGLVDTFEQHPSYVRLADHFSISAKEAVALFCGVEDKDCSIRRHGHDALSRLRAFIDANKPAEPTIPSMDFRTTSIAVVDQKMAMAK